MPTPESESGEKRVDERSRGDARATLTATAIGTVVLVAAYLLLVIVPGNRTLVEAVQFAGTSERFTDRLRSADVTMSLGDARLAMVAALVFTVVWGAVGYYVLYGLKSPTAEETVDGKARAARGHWDYAWKAAPGTKIPGRALALGLVAGAAIGLVEKLVALAALSDDGGALQLRGDPVLPAVIVTLAWAKWLIAGLAIVAIVIMAVSALTAAIRPPVRTAPADHTDRGSDGNGQAAKLASTAAPAETEIAGSRPVVGVSCSGGGIRSAGFTLGALSALERVLGPDGTTRGLGILGRADYLASVSGGGYAAAAWRILVGTGAELPDQPVIGVPDDPERRIHPYPDNREGAADLIQHVRERRRFLANGTGGLPISVGIAVTRTLWHLLLLVLAVYALAWPLGRIVASWHVSGVGRRPSALDDGIDVSLGVHQWLPPVVLAVLALAVWSWRLTLDRSPERKRVDLAAAGLAGAAAALALVLVVLPYAIDGFVTLVGDLGAEGAPGGLVVTGVYGVVLTAIWQFAKRRLAPVAKYLGGFLLAIGVIGFALFVMANAADTNGPFSSIWILPVVLAILGIAMVEFNPDRWSLHSLYRSRLAGTFVTTRDESGRIRPLTAEPALSEFADAGGPTPVICCAAARGDNSHTGIPALSMTFEPTAVNVYRWPKGRADGPTPEALPLDVFTRRLPRTVDGRNLAAPMGAAAVSGAAVAPSLGRMSLRSTNALLAAFNARLGAWIPNPRAAFGYETTPRLVNMFKEMFGLYDENDPNVYATDGGHWENLGLVELIRRECDVIICLDATADPPGSYTTLRQAIQLAALECCAVIEVSDETWSTLAMDEYGMCKRNFGRAKVKYHDSETGALRKTGHILYVKAAVMSRTSLPIQRYASADRTFPQYSTGDQFLRDDELNHLMQLGFESVKMALEEHPEIPAIVFGSASPREDGEPPPPASAVPSGTPPLATAVTPTSPGGSP